MSAAVCLCAVTGSFLFALATLSNFHWRKQAIKNKTNTNRHITDGWGCQEIRGPLPRVACTDQTTKEAKTHGMGNGLKFPSFSSRPSQARSARHKRSSQLKNIRLLDTLSRWTLGSHSSKLICWKEEGVRDSQDILYVKRVRTRTRFLTHSTIKHANIYNTLVDS